MPRYKYSKLKLKQVSNSINTSVIPINEFGATVKNIRESLGMSQSQLAVRVSMTQQAIQLIENNKNSPSISTIQKIAGVFGATISIKFNLEKSLEQLIEDRAGKKAKAIIDNVSSNTAMEKQAVDESLNEIRLKELTDEFIQNPQKGLWD